MPPKTRRKSKSKADSQVSVSVDSQINSQLINVAIELLPGVLDWLRDAFANRDPNSTPLTDAEVIAAYQQALTSSLNKDQAWLDAHPEDDPNAPNA